MEHIERKQRDKENIRNNILKAAIDIAIAEGWQAVTIRRISEAIEYTTSIVYAHFENKEALLDELRNDGFKLLYQMSEKALNAEIDPKKQLLNISIANWDFAFENKELYQLMFNMSRPTGDIAFKGLDLIGEIFLKLSGKNKEEVKPLFLNWICLRRGCIGLLMDFKTPENRRPDEGINPRNLYIEFIERFISSIAKK